MKRGSLITASIRSGELYALRWADIDLENKIIHVGRSWSSKNEYTSTKNQKVRVVPISLELLQFLQEWKLKGETKEFVLPHLTEWSRGDAAEVTEIKFHDLRATFITSLFTRGEALARVMAIYLRLAGVDIKGATDKLGYEIPTNQSATILRFPNFGCAE